MNQQCNDRRHQTKCNACPNFRQQAGLNFSEHADLHDSFAKEEALWNAAMWLVPILVAITAFFASIENSAGIITGIAAAITSIAIAVHKDGRYSKAEHQIAAKRWRREAQQQLIKEMGLDEASMQEHQLEMLKRLELDASQVDRR